MREEFDGFSVQLYLDEDEEWLAHFAELPNVSAFSDTPEKALKELKVAWEGVKKSYKDSGQDIPIAPSKKTYSGQFNVRIPNDVHRRLAMEAARRGVSLNALVSERLSTP